jgi:hypothetical protein
VDAKLRAVHVHDDTQAGDELLDYAAAQTVMRGGDVYAVDADQLPANNASPAAALLRYVA